MPDHVITLVLACQGLVTHRALVPEFKLWALGRKSFSLLFDLKQRVYGKCLGVLVTLFLTLDKLTEQLDKLYETDLLFGET